MWSIELSRDATKALLRMPRSDAHRIRERLDELVLDPWSARKAKKLTDHPGFRLRVGDWRVVYVLIEDRLIVQVVRIARREKAYR